MIDLSLEHFELPPFSQFLNCTFNIRSCIYPEVDMDINLRHERYCDNDCNRINIDVKIQPSHTSMSFYVSLKWQYFEQMARHQIHIMMWSC